MKRSGLFGWMFWGAIVVSLAWSSLFMAFVPEAFAGHTTVEGRGPHHVGWHHDLIPYDQYQLDRLYFRVYFLRETADPATEKICVADGHYALWAHDGPGCPGDDDPAYRSPELLIPEKGKWLVGCSTYFQLDSGDIYESAIAWSEDSSMTCQGMTWDYLWIGTIGCISNFMISPSP